MHTFQEEQLLKQIDEALDQDDKEKFYELSELLQALRTDNQYNELNPYGMNIFYD